MDITLLSAEGLPPRTYVSMRIGETRRQAPFQANERFSFPAGAGSTAKCLTVDLFEKLGSRQVSLAGLGEDSSLFQQNHLDFSVKDGKTMQVDFKVELSSGDLSAKKSSRVSRHQAALRAKNYLDDYSVQGVLQDMVQELLAKQPADPLEYMCEFLQDRRKRAPPAKPPKAKAMPIGEGRALPDYSKEPGLGELDYPGFSPYLCPEALQSLDTYHNVLARVLQREPAVYYTLRERRTANGVALARCIKPGMDDQGSHLSPPVGLVAGDASSYDVFAELFDKVIVEAQQLPGQKLATVPLSCFDAGEVSIHSGAAFSRLATSVRVSVRRNLAGLCFPSACSRDERREVERAVSSALEELIGDFAGEYFPLPSSAGPTTRPQGSSLEETERLAKAGKLIVQPHTVAKLSAGLGRHWPEARGVFVSDSGLFTVVVNDEDHIRLQADCSRCNIVEALQRARRFHAALEQTLRQEGHSFACSSRHGYLCTSPAYSGTGLEAQVSMRLPKLSALESFREICGGLRLSPTLSSTAGIIEITNVQCLGTSAAAQVELVVKGCNRLAELEVKLEKGESITDLASRVEDKDAKGAEDQGTAGKAPGAAATDAIASGHAEAPKAPTPGLGDEEYPGFEALDCPEDLPDLSRHYSLMASVFKKDQALFQKLRGLKTSTGVTLSKVIKPGIDNRGHAMIRTAGLVAGDEGCYETFGPLFDAVLLQRPGGVLCSTHPTDMDASQVESGEIDPTNKHVLEVQVRISRNLRGLRFPPACTLKERREAERLLTKALLSLKGDFAGRYFPLSGSDSFVPLPEGMSQADEKALNEDGILFTAPDSQFVLSSGMGRHWPDARGVFSTPSRDVYAWINEEEHLKLTAQLPGSDFQQVFANLCTVEKGVLASLLSEGYDFARSSDRGFLTTCPTNAGTGLRASAVLHLPHLAASQGSLRESCKRLGLQVRNVGSVCAGPMCEVSNIQRLGTSEVDQVTSVVFGIRQLIQLEEAQAKLVASGAAIKVTEDESGMRQVPSMVQQPSGVSSMPLSVMAEDEESGQEDDGDEDDGFSREMCPEQMPDITSNFTIMATVLRRDPAIYDRLRTLKTNLGVNFAQVIKPGMDLEGHPLVRSLGAVAGDAESFNIFQSLMDPVIKLGVNFDETVVHQTDFMDISKVTDNLRDLQGSRVHSLRLEASRNLQEFRFPSTCSKEERQQIERLVTSALAGMRDTFAGAYIPLSKETTAPGTPSGSLPSEAQLRSAGLWMEDPDSAILLSMGLGRDWPDARGVFVAQGASAAVWVNGEDHLRLIITRAHADVKELLTAFGRIHSELQKRLDAEGAHFAHMQRLGFLGPNLSNLGTAMRLSIQLTMKHLPTKNYFRDLCRQLGLTVRRVPGDKDSGLQEISNLERLGYSEAELVNIVVAGARQLGLMEDALEKGLQVDRPGFGAMPLGPFPTEVCPEQLPDLATHQSHMAQVLKANPGLWAELRSKQTELGVNLAQVVKPGMDSKRGTGHLRQFGMVAGDAASYEVYGSLFEPALESFHGISIPVAHPPLDNARNSLQGSNSLLHGIAKSVLDVRVSMARSLRGLRFPPSCSVEERREVERVLANALSGLSGHLEGQYHPLSSSGSIAGAPWSEADGHRLKAAGLLLEAPEAANTLSAGIGRQWPDARGLFTSKDNGLAAWVNGEEHLMLVAMQEGADLEATYETACVAEQALNTRLQQEGYGFAWSDRLGFLTAFPERLGSGLTVTVSLRLPKLAASACGPEVLGNDNVVVRALARRGVFEVANRVTLGVSGVDIMRQVAEAAAKLVAAEAG